MRPHAVVRFWAEAHEEPGLPGIYYEEFFVRCGCGQVFRSLHPAAVRSFHREHADLERAQVHSCDDRLLSHPEVLR
jgi:hypothetical protein